jgi:NitT/TauT family transport system substrate-binding protein
MAFQEKRTYKIGTVSWIGWSPLNVAQAKGFFKEAGVDVEIVWFRGTEPIAQAFEKGEIDFRLDFLAAVMDLVREGTKVKLLAETVWSHGGDKIVGKRGNTFAESQGAKVGVYLDSSAVNYFLDLYLKSLGSNRFTDYQIQHMEPEPLAQAFINGEVDFMINFDPYVQNAIREGNGVVLANSSQFIGAMPEGIFAKEEVINAIPMEDMVAILKAWVQASDWLHDPKNWVEYTEILNRDTFKDQEDFPMQQLRFLRKSVRIHNSQILAVRNRDQGGSYKYLDNLRAFLVRIDQGGVPRDVSTLIDNRAILKALE